MSVMSKTKNTVSKSSPKGSKTAASMQPQSLETLTSSSSPVPLKNTKALSTYLQQAFPANHSAKQVSKKVGKTRATSGQQQSNVFATWDQDMHCWKTSQLCLIADTSPKFLGRWPNQGMMRDGLCWEHPMWEPHTGAKDSGFWLTPTASDWKNMDTANQPMLSAQVKWPTPTVGHVLRGNHDEPVKNYLKRVRDYEEGRTKGKPGKSLGVAVRIAGTKDGQLNPTWVEWLMGWPLGWTDLKPLETGSVQQWLRQHGKS